MSDHGFAAQLPRGSQRNRYYQQCGLADGPSEAIRDTAPFSQGGAYSNATMLRLNLLAVNVVVTALSVGSNVGALAQLQGSSTIEGRVISADQHTPLSRVRVVLQSPHELVTIFTDRNGVYQFSDLVAGRYTLSASQPGYLPAADSRNPARIQVEKYQVVHEVDLELLRATVLAGTLSDRNGDPVANGVVRISRQSPDQKERDESVTTGTDDRGAFRMWGMPPGVYLLTPDAGGESHSVSLKPGEELDNIQLISAAAPVARNRETRRGMISGTIYDDAGNPAAGAKVEAHPLKGEAFSSAGATARANDRGEYRLWGLLPGRYYLSATPMLTSPINGVGARVQGGSGLLAYAQTFYPGTETLNRAEPVIVRQQEEVSGIDLSLRLGPVILLKGTVYDGNVARQNAIIALTERALNDSQAVTTFTTRSNSIGAFEFENVPAGQYTVEAILDGSQPKYASAALVIAGATVPDLALVLHEGIKIAGTITAESNTARFLDPKAITLSIHGVSGLVSGRSISARVGEHGSFTLSGILPGRYIFETSNVPANWRLRSIRIGGVKTMAGVFEIPADGLAGKLELIFGDSHP